jgi:transposase
MTLYVRPLLEKERSQLGAMIAQSRPETLGTRAHIVLLSSQGYSSTEIASLVGRHPASIRKWIHRFNDQGIACLTDAPSPGRKRSYSEDQAQKIVDIALTEPRALGQPYSRWSLHRLVRYVIHTGVLESVSHDTIWRILRNRGIHFQKGEGWSRNDKGTR